MASGERERERERVCVCVHRLAMVRDLTEVGGK